jgi:16S rRNA processing protein RimM
MSQDLIVVGQIGGAFGVKGEARVRSFTQDPEAIFTYGKLLDEHGALVIDPKSVRTVGDDYAVTPATPVQREHWEGMKGKLLHVPRDILPEAIEDDEEYVVDLEGCAVVHASGRQLGEVKSVQNFGAGDLLEVKPSEGAVYFLPFSKEAVVDLEARIITLDCHEDFLPDASSKDEPE